MSEEKKVLLSLKDVEVKFKVRGRLLTAIRGVSMDIYDGETLAIVGESGSGKSVLTKTFSGMLDSNGFISKGSIILNDEEISRTILPMDEYVSKVLTSINSQLDDLSRYENSREFYLELKAIKPTDVTNSAVPIDDIKLYFDFKSALNNTIVFVPMLISGCVFAYIPKSNAIKSIPALPKDMPLILMLPTKYPRHIIENITQTRDIVFTTTLLKYISRSSIIYILTTNSNIF